MPFGMGPAGWAYVRPYAYPYPAFPYPVWSWGYGRRMGWGRGLVWRRFRPYWRYPWW